MMPRRKSFGNPPETPPETPCTAAVKLRGCFLDNFRWDIIAGPHGII